MISVIELIDFLKPVYSVFYPHDMESFVHCSEIPWLDLFDMIMLPYTHNLYYRLLGCCQRVEVVGWMKKQREVHPAIDQENPVYSPVFFPSNIITFYENWGPKVMPIGSADMPVPTSPLKCRLAMQESSLCCRKKGIRSSTPLNPYMT